MKQELINRIKKDWVKYMMLLLLLFIIYNQINIVKTIYESRDKLDRDPFSYGAEKFGIKEATCFISESKTLYFNQTGSKFIIKQKPFF